MALGRCLGMQIGIVRVRVIRHPHQQRRLPWRELPGRWHQDGAVLDRDALVLGTLQVLRRVGLIGGVNRLILGIEGDVDGSGAVLPVTAK